MSIEGMLDITQQGRHMIAGKENLDSVYIYKGIQIREEDQPIYKESQDIFKSMKIQIIPE